jgi:hypothetical protein
MDRYMKQKTLAERGTGASSIEITNQQYFT